jgi:hypothetical protein
MRQRSSDGYGRGFRVDGRRLIYVNATEERDPCGSLPTGGEADSCDGGECCWGALFDLLIVGAGHFPGTFQGRT